VAQAPASRDATTLGDRLRTFTNSGTTANPAEKKQQPEEKKQRESLPSIASPDLPSRWAEPNNQALPLSIDPALTDPATRAAYLQSLQGYYEYHRWGLGLRRQTFEWQLLSSRIIFVVVLSLVGIGIYFAWVQFYADRRSEAPPVITEISAGKEGLRVSSPVLGVIILVISLLFFYLYLAFVYPISQTF
jgi:hypothetical protein